MSERLRSSELPLSPASLAREAYTDHRLPVVRIGSIRDLADIHKHDEYHEARKNFREANIREIFGSKVNVQWSYLGCLSDMDLWQIGDGLSVDPDTITMAVSRNGNGLYFAEELAADSLDLGSETLTRWSFEPVTTLEDVGRQLIRRDAAVHMPKIIH